MAYMKLFMSVAYWYLAVKTVAKTLYHIKKNNTKSCFISMAEGCIDYALLYGLSTLVV